MTGLGWGGGDGRPAKKECPECGKMVRGLKQHRCDAHRHPERRQRSPKIIAATTPEVSNG